MTTSATAPISASLEMPSSSTSWNSGFLARFDVDGRLVGRSGGRSHLRRRPSRCIAGGGGGRTVLHAVLEALHGATEVGAHVLELFGAKHHHDDQKNDQPVPDRKRTHGKLLKNCCNFRRRKMSAPQPGSGAAHDVNMEMLNFLAALGAS